MRRQRAAGLAAALLVAGCAHYEVRPSPRAAVSAAPGASGVVVSAAAQADAESAFDADLRGARVAPVWLTLANHTAETIALSRHDVAAFTAQGRRCPALTLGETYERIRFKPAARYLAWSLGLLGIGIIPGIVDHFKAEAANRTIWQDLDAKQLPDGNVTPGGTLGGFLFFDTAPHGPPVRLTVTLTGPDGAVRDASAPLDYAEPAGTPSR